MSLSIRSLLVGAAVLIVGYFVCVTLLVAASSSGEGHGLSLLLALAPIVVASAVAGFIGALFAPEKPLLHGTFGAGFGALVLFLFTVFGARAFHQTTDLEQALPFVAMVALAFCGALIAVYVWPRHGL